MNYKKSSFLLPMFGYALTGMALLTSSNVYAQKNLTTYSASQQVIEKGDELFQKNCSDCHNFHQRGIGPDLSGVTADASYSYLSKFIVNSQQLVKSGNKRAVTRFNEFNKVPMPAHPELKAADLNAILSFINTHKKVVEIEKDLGDLGPKITNPQPQKIAKAGMTLKLTAFTTAPATSAKNPLTRINQTLVLKGPKGNRLFMLDLRGKLYEIKNKQFTVVMDMAKEKPNFISEPGLASGWGSYAFHPDFYKNGLLYTTHTEKKNSAPADFAYPDSIPVALQWIVTEWKVKDPTASVFEATPRELFRVNMPSTMHGMQQIIFNPQAKSGSADYGLLYIDIGDGGSAEYRFPQLCDNPTQIRASVLRINPMGRNSKNGKYGIVSANTWAHDDDPNTLGEVYARGFRNPNRISWAPDGKILVTEIGFNNQEEINILKPGHDYGWPNREGTFRMVFSSKKSGIYNLPAHDDPKYTYPVAEYDHDEGNSISGGFVYTGNIPMLKGKYIFGDIVKGRIFYVDYNDLKLGKQSVIKEFDLQFGDQKSTFIDMVKNKKADIRFGQGENNALYVWSKTDGKIWQVTGCVAN
ncbi:MAG TPA: PQQ-dependent sugar dehydrogenase [Mucilaginibacter sp.]